MSVTCWNRWSMFVIVQYKFWAIQKFRYSVWIIEKNAEKLWKNTIIGANIKMTFLGRWRRDHKWKQNSSSTHTQNSEKKRKVLSGTNVNLAHDNETVDKACFDCVVVRHPKVITCAQPVCSRKYCWTKSNRMNSQDSYASKANWKVWRNWTLFGIHCLKSACGGVTVSTQQKYHSHVAQSVRRRHTRFVIGANGFL